MSRRHALVVLGALGLPTRAAAFGQEGSFHPRILLTQNQSFTGPRTTAPERWSWELMRRTSAPARLVVGSVRADEARLLHEPLALWVGERPGLPLTDAEVRRLRTFVRLGGVLVVDDFDPARGAFVSYAKEQIARVIPESPIEPVPERHVLYRSYYLIDRPVGRVQGAPRLEAVFQGKFPRVLFLAHDLLGALARAPGDSFTMPVEPGGPRQREWAIRLAINIAMYVLCADYKDDQVHASELMRRRGAER